MQGGNDSAAARGAWLRTNQGVAVCIAVVVIALLINIGLSDWAFQKLRDGFRLGFFSALAALGMLACAVAMMFDRHRGETDPDMAQTRWRDWIIAVGAMAVCFIYFELAWWLDFLLVTPVFMAGATYVLGVRPLRTSVIAGIAITVVIYGLFYLIGIDLPSRIIGL